jgi:hypothetical protein
MTMYIYLFALIFENFFLQCGHHLRMVPLAVTRVLKWHVEFHRPAPPPAPQTPHLLLKRGAAQKHLTPRPVSSPCSSPPTFSLLFLKQYVLAFSSRSLFLEQIDFPF